MEKEPLPPPLSSGTEDSVTIEVENDSDYEIMFIPDNTYYPGYQIENNEGSYLVHVEYDLERSVRREMVGFLIYGISLLILSIGSGVIAIIGHRRSRSPDDDRRT
jgi:hypothetical protein